MANVRLDSVTKVYSGQTVVDRVSIEIPSGQLCTLLGPSGCGKTTCLNMVAGFVRPNGGDILINGQRITDTPPHKRDTSMVFQGYALFPHLTVTQNVAFGLRMRSVPRADLGRRVKTTLDLVQLTALAGRYPRELSGGQQQRVALARSLVVSPKVLLLDEPLSNLDAKLREQMREEIRRLQQRVGITAIYVTHDQEEALAISDKVVLMNVGRIEQEGTPEDIYARPTSEFAARFIGGANVIDVSEVLPSEFGLRLRIVDRSEPRSAFELTFPSGEKWPSPCKLAFRPEHVRIESDGPFAARYEFSVFLGTRILGVFSMGETVVRGCLTDQQRKLLREGDRLNLAVDLDKAVLVG